MRIVVDPLFVTHKQKEWNGDNKFELVYNMAAEEIEREEVELVSENEEFDSEGEDENADLC